MKLRRFVRRADSGQATIEFALAIPVLLLVVLGTFDVARAVWQENTLAFAAREGARYAIVRGSVCPCTPVVQADVATYVQRYTIGVPNVTVTAAWPSGNDPGSPVTVTATSRFVPIASRYFLGGALQVTLTGGSTMIIQQ